MSLSSASPEEIAQSASVAARSLAVLPAEARNEALAAIHAELAASKDAILAANARDVAAGQAAVAAGTLSQSVLKRLDLARPGKWADMLQGIEDVRALADPAGRVTLRTKLDDGLELRRVSAPIGVLLVIFEARPEVIANIAALAVKSGNAAILKGGKETTESFVAVASAISRALAVTRVPAGAIQLVRTHGEIASLLALDKLIDLVIPRGSNALVSKIKATTKIPVLGHSDGLCHIYLRADIDPDTAVRLVVDSKCGYPAACNAVETLVVDHEALESVFPPVAAALLAKGVSLRCDAPSKAALVKTLGAAQAAILQDATDADYATEFLDLILAVKTVPQADALAAVDMAVAHINDHSSHHTDAILTADEAAARRFQAGVDSACVFWNTSTRMADGMRFGFGTEVGISTNKIHARGPVGLEGLMIYKYVIDGSGQSAADYFDGEGGKTWKHESLPLQ